MLMYRQVEPKKNCLAVKVAEFPDHIKSITLQNRIKEREETDKKRNNISISVLKAEVYYYDEQLSCMSDVKIHISSDSTLEEIQERAYDRLNLRPVCPIERTRLVAYDHVSEMMLCSFDKPETELIQEVYDRLNECKFLMETRKKDEHFEKYDSPGMKAKVYLVDMRTADVEGPASVFAKLSGTVGDLKSAIKKTMKLDSFDAMRLAIYKSNFALVLSNDKDVLKHEIDTNAYEPVKVFVANYPEAARTQEELFDKRFKKIAERFDKIISLYFKVPDINEEILKTMAIPKFTQPEETKAISSAKEQVDIIEPPVREVETLKLSLTSQTNGKSDVTEPVEVTATCPVSVKAVSPAKEQNIKENGVAVTSPTLQNGSVAVASPKKKKIIKVIKKNGVVVKKIDEDGVETKATTTKKSTLTTAVPQQNGVEGGAAGDGTLTVEPKSAKVKKELTPEKSKKRVTVQPAQNIVNMEVSVEEKKDANSEAKVEETVEVKKVEENGKPPKDVDENYDFLSSPSVELMTEPEDTLYYCKTYPIEDIPDGPKTDREDLRDRPRRLARVLVDKRTTLGNLKLKLEPVIGVPKEYFKISHRTEITRLTETLASYK